MNVSALWDILSQAKMEGDRVEWHSILRGTLSPVGQPVHCLTVLEHGHT